LVGPAIEESLRKDSPVQLLTRTPFEDAELDGTAVPAGCRVFTGLGAANRDETVFERAAEFDLDRDRTVAHVAFGVGPHLVGFQNSETALICGFRLRVRTR
jgi:cytochrome P450